MPLDARLMVRSLSLSESERADLAHRLLLSLEPAVSESPQEVETAWAVCLVLELAVSRNWFDRLGSCLTGQQRRNVS